MGKRVPQADADALLQIDKLPTDPARIVDFPVPAERIRIPLVSTDRRIEFDLDVNRGRIKLSQCTYHGQSRRLVLLARLDLDGPPHTNPDGTDIPCPHLHLYREGFGDKWAEPIPSGVFSGLTDLLQTLLDFMLFIHVVQMPPIQNRIAFA